MARLKPNRNTPAPAVLAAEIESVIADAAAGPLCASRAAALMVLLRLNGTVTPEQAIAACINLLREQAKRHAENIASLKDDYAQDIGALEDKLADIRALAEPAEEGAP